MSERGVWVVNVADGFYVFVRQDKAMDFAEQKWVKESKNGAVAFVPFSQFVKFNQ